MVPTFFRPLSCALLLACLAPCHVPAPAAPAPLPIVTARLSITFAGNGYWLVVVSGQASAANQSLGIKVYGDDTWFDDHLFDIMAGFARTGFDGSFSYSRMVHRSTLNEDPEGTDEIYATVNAGPAGSTRTNTHSQSF